MDIIALIKDQLDDHFTNAAAGVTGLGAEQTGKAVGATVPAVLASVLGSASTSTGKRTLESVLADQDPSLLDNLSSMLGGQGQQSLVSSGIESMTSMLGEGKLTGLVRELSRFAGIGPAAGKSLLGLVAPVVMGVLGREQRKSGIDGLVEMLQGQRANIARAMPSGLASALKPLGLLDGIGEAARPTYEEPARARVHDVAAQARRESAYERPRRRNWGIIAAVVAALAAIAWAMTRDRTPDVEPARQARQAAPAPAPERTANASQLLVGGVDVGREFSAITDRLSDTVRDVHDEASAQAALPRLSQLNDEIDELAPLLDRLPGSAKPAFTDMARDKIAALQPEIERIRSLSAVPEVVKDTVETLGDKLESMVA